jgi:hypothetical protein
MQLVGHERCMTGVSLLSFFTMGVDRALKKRSMTP